MHLSRSAGENMDNLCNSGKFGKLHFDVVSRLRDEDGNVKFRLEIIRVGN